MKLATEFKPNYTRQNSDTSEILSTSGESVNIFQKVYQIIEDLDSALLELKEAGYDAAVADNDMRRAKAQAFLKGVGSNATARESSTDHLWQDARLTSSIAENRREVALEVVRSYRQKLSAIQSVLSAMKSEADVVKYGQNTGA